MSAKRRGKGLSKKNSVWYFDSRRQPTMKKVEILFSNYATREFKDFNKKPEVNISICNRKNITTKGLDEGLAKVTMLNPLDFYKIIRWVRRGNINLHQFDEQKIVFYNYPLKPIQGMEIENPGNFFICMEQDRLTKNWLFAIRAEEYLRAQGYRIACLER